MTHGRHSGGGRRFRPVGGRRLRRRWLVALAVVPLVIAVPAFASTAFARSTPKIVFSHAADHSSSSPLAGARVSGPVYVFLAGKDVSRVTYYLDRSRTSGTPYSRSSSAPFDLVATGAGGAARPLDLTRLSAGSHTLVASITRADGSNRVLTSKFTVSVADTTAAARGSAGGTGPTGVATVGPEPTGPASSGDSSSTKSSGTSGTSTSAGHASTTPATEDPSGSGSGSSSSGGSGSSSSSGSGSSSSSGSSGSSTPPTVPAPAGSSGLSSLQVSGNQFVEAGGKPVRLVGFNFSGAEYACIENSGIFDTPETTAVTASEIQAMRSWTGANVVRVNLNEQCWLGIGGAAAGSSGSTYQGAIRTLVAELNKAGFYVVLDLHRSAPGNAASKEQEPMPDRDHSPTFWSQVAAAYKSNLAVAFDLFNEPFPYGGADTTQAWQCWRDGGCTQTSANGGGSYVAAGMNELISAVRATGSQNVVLAGGLNYAEVTSHWLQYKPTDPTGNTAVSVHVYSFNDCSSTSCYNGDMASVAAKVPMFVGEFGPDLTIKSGFDQSCPQSAIGSSGFSATLVDWMDAHSVSYSAWAYDPWGDCWSLVKDWSGAPTPVWGAEIKARIAKSAAMS